MAEIKFDYNPWDDNTDILLHRPGSDLGYTAILTSLEVGDMSSVKKRKDDRLIKETEEGAVALLAGSLEWLRSRGYSAEQVQSKVKAYKQDNLDRRDQTVLKDKTVLKAINDYSNPKALTLADTVVIG